MGTSSSNFSASDTEGGTGRRPLDPLVWPDGIGCVLRANELLRGPLARGAASPAKAQSSREFRTRTKPYLLYETKVSSLQTLSRRKIIRRALTSPAHHLLFLYVIIILWLILRVDVQQHRPTHHRFFSFV